MPRGPAPAAGYHPHDLQPWPSRSKKLREYISRSPRRHPPRGPAPRASAARWTVSTSSRDDTLKQYSASVCVVDRPIGSFANSANFSAAEQA